MTVKMFGPTPILRARRSGAEAYLVVMKYYTEAFYR